MGTLDMSLDTSPDSLPTDVSLLDDFSITDLLASAGNEAWAPGGYLADGDGMNVPPLLSGPVETCPPFLRQLMEQGHEAPGLEIDPLHVHDPNTRFGSIVAFLSSLPATLADTRALPFMHPRLWPASCPSPSCRPSRLPRPTAPARCRPAPGRSSSSPTPAATSSARASVQAPRPPISSPACRR